VTIRGTDTVGTGIAATDDDDVLAIDVDRVGFALLNFLVLRNQEFQRSVNTLELTARHRQFARHFGSGGQNHGIEIRHQRIGRDNILGIVVDAGRQILVANQNLGLEGNPSASIWATRRSITVFSILKSGIP
jgi:hypothetical protein